MGRAVTVSERRLSGKTSLKVNCNYGDVHHWRNSGWGVGWGQLLAHRQGGEREADWRATTKSPGLRHGCWCWAEGAGLFSRYAGCGEGFTSPLVAWSYLVSADHLNVIHFAGLTCSAPAFFSPVHTGVGVENTPPPPPPTPRGQIFFSHSYIASSFLFFFFGGEGGCCATHHSLLSIFLLMEKKYRRNSHPSPVRRFWMDVDDKGLNSLPRWRSAPRQTLFPWGGSLI